MCARLRTGTQNTTSSQRNWEAPRWSGRCTGCEVIDDDTHDGRAARRGSQIAAPSALIEKAMPHRSMFYLVVALVVAFGGCGSDKSPTGTSPVTVTAELRAALDRSIQDEYLAETTYQGVLNDLGPLQPFVNVLTAEQRHSASIAELYTRRGLVAPTSAWTLDTVPHYSTTNAACSAAASAERANIAMYDELLRLNLPNDVRQVFTNNRSASLLNHLPAFERCS
jgi:hypothetical protein